MSVNEYNYASRLMPGFSSATVFNCIILEHVAHSERKKTLPFILEHHREFIKILQKKERYLPWWVTDCFIVLSLMPELLCNFFLLNFVTVPFIFHLKL